MITTVSVSFTVAHGPEIPPKNLQNALLDIFNQGATEIVAGELPPEFSDLLVCVQEPSSIG